MKKNQTVRFEREAEVRSLFTKNIAQANVSVS